MRLRRLRRILSIATFIVLGSISSVLLGCSPSEDSPAVVDAPTADAPSADARSAGEGTIVDLVPEEPAGGPRDLAGLVAEVHDDGRITLSGVDRWGNRLDTTYGSLDFLANAVPVLERAITEEQARALEEFVAERSGAGGTNL